MAEPEDVEEDLFADLYDADETTNQTAPAGGVSAASNPVPSDAPAQPSGVGAIQSIEGYANEAENTHGAYHHGSYNGGYQNGGANIDTGFHKHAHAPASAGEPEPQGTGIKEDG